MSFVRRAWLEITYENTDITRDISVDLLDFSYNDNESGKADDISISLKDEDFLWHGAWNPSFGDIIDATIVLQDQDGEQSRLRCGKFTIDEMESTGMPTVFNINAVSVPLNKNIRRQKKSKAWENVKLSSIADDVADNGDLTLVYLPEFNPLYDRRDQREETDLQFLQRLCKDEAFALKITDNKLVVFDPKLQEESDPVIRIFRVGGDLKSWNFKQQANDVYNKCVVKYKDPKTGKVNEYTYTDPSIEQDQTFTVTKRAASIAEAERIAKATLTEKNRNQTTGTLTMIGNPNLVTGLTVELLGFGVYSGKYLITKSSHKVGSGYETSLDLKKVENADAGQSTSG